MVDFGNNHPDTRPLADLLTKKLRPGDIYTHMYSGLRNELVDGKPNPGMIEGRKRGVIFDVGHGGGSFAWRVAVPMVKAGFIPDSISTDLHISSMNAGMKDMLNVMDKFLAMGIPLPKVIAQCAPGTRPARSSRTRWATCRPAPSPTSPCCAWRRASSATSTCSAPSCPARERLTAEMTLKDGKVVYELNGLARPEWTTLPADYKNDRRAHVGRDEEVTWRKPNAKKTTNRRTFLKAAPAAAAAAVAAVPAAASAQGTAAAPVKKVHWSGGKPPEKTPLFSGIVQHGSLIFIAGIGAHFEGDIKAHTKHVLDEIQKRLESVGSSMEKVLKVNVYLNDLKDYAAMNEVFLGRFGPEPGVRTTIAAAGGIPGNSLVEIDCIACV